MSYTIEEINGCTKKLIFDFKELDLTGQIESALKEKQKETSIKGFRKGKAPLDMVNKLYGQQIESDALNKFIQEKFFEAVQKENLLVVGYPTFENMKYVKGESVVFDAKVELFPQFELKDYSDYSFQKDKVEIDEDEVTKLSKMRLESKAQMVSIEDKDQKLEKGHFAVLNFQGVKEDGERPENMKGNDYQLEIGSSQFIPGFEEGLEGLKAGEKKDLNLDFPESYHVDELKNAKVTFEVELLEIKEKKFPELTDELAKELGFESVEDMNEKNRNNLIQQKERSVNEKLKQEIVEKFVLDNQFDVPTFMLAQQKEYIKKDLDHNLKAQGFNDEMIEEYYKKWDDDVNKKTEFQVRSGLILESLKKKFNVETTDADVDAKIKETASQSGMDEDQIRKYYEANENVKKNLMYSISEEKTFEKLMEEIKITE